jgi:transposase InsO family protein
MRTKDKKVGAGNRKFSDSERKEIIRGLKACTGSKEEYFRAQGITKTSVYRWIKSEKEKKGDRNASRLSSQDESKELKGLGQIAARKEAVEAFLKSGSTYQEFAKVWGVSATSISTWHKIFEERGAKGLEAGIYGERKRGRKGSSPHLKDQIVLVQKENPGFGLKKVRDFLFRFRGLKVSTGTVRKTVEAANLPRAPLPPKKRHRSSDKIRRFERAKPMQLWQSDITSFVLTRHSQRVYLTVFMDDHSRYVVAWSLQLRQKSDLVMDSLLQGIQKFGKPLEVLTDQGRQYFSWRGKSDFQKLLDKEGIRHVVARSHHPQTLGKCERFWETVGQEFWERVKPQELEETKKRFAHFIAHYNHFRPHQGIDGMTPADRFFGLALEVRKAIEETLTQNELRLAVGEAPRSPVFLIGQIGDQPVSLHGESGSLVVQTGQGEMQRIEYSNFGHASPAAKALSSETPTSLPTKGESDVGNETAVRSNTSDGFSSAERNNVPEKISSQDETSASHASDKAPGSDSQSLGVGKSCPEGAGSSNGSSPDGVLVGSIEQAGDCHSIECADASSLADVSASDLRYGSRTAQSTESPNQESCDVDSSGGRSETFAAPNPRTGETGSDSTPLDCDLARDAGQSGCAPSQGESGEADRAPSDGASREECNTRQEGQTSTEAESTNTDDVITGRRS